MKPAWLVLILGVVCLLLSGGILLVSILVPIINAPRASFDEAVPFLIGGGCCSAVSLLIVLAGVLWLLVGNRR